MITSDELAILCKPEVQEYIREKMGDIEAGDLVNYDTFPVQPHVFSVDLDMLYDKNERDRLNDLAVSRIPDCISRDSERPERGLIGMLDGFYSLVKLRYYGIGWRVVIQKGTSSAAWRNFDANIPRLALLKALEWQIEQEGRDERT